MTLDSTHNSTSDSMPQDPFFEFYDRDDPAYGLTPSPELAAVLQQLSPNGRALDLGAGAGRDALALAQCGLEVTCVDLSQRGLEQILERARERGLEDRISVQHADVRDVEIQAGQYDVIIGTTVLDHIPADDAATVWQRMVNGLRPQGILYVEVHSSDDPGCAEAPSANEPAPVSETAAWVIHYFDHGKLLRWAMDAPSLRVLRYEERLEWDYTHGPEHKHAKAILLATTAQHRPEWYGHPAAFPRQN